MDTIQAIDGAMQSTVEKVGALLSETSRPAQALRGGGAGVPPDAAEPVQGSSAPQHLAPAGPEPAAMPGGAHSQHGRQS